MTHVTDPRSTKASWDEVASAVWPLHVAHDEEKLLVRYVPKCKILLS